jgi:tRNA(Ile)-lysidine synthase
MDKVAAERFLSDLQALASPLPERIGVAVSGGPDSLALLLLAAQALPDRVSAATVDHGLRPEAADEAKMVTGLCRRLGVPHRILGAKVERDGEGLQAAARAARYDALAAWMAEEHIPLLLTAHHADDQAETLLMRLMRGSGVAGLAGVRPLRPLEPRRLLCRPLLGWRREELAAIVEAAGLSAVDDPSNWDGRHDRVRLRRSLETTSWLDPLPLSRSAAALAEAEEALAFAADRLAGERISGHGPLALDPSDLPAEILRRVTLLCLKRIDPAACPRGAEVARLIATLRSGGSATIAGVKAGGGAVWTFEAAPPRRPVKEA